VSSSIFERHPDQDLLADLAAEVLPQDQARSVEAHVIGCRTCAELLADAERVRRLLVNNDPGPMPADVWARIEAALAVESGQLTTAGRDHSAVPPPARITSMAGSLPPVELDGGAPTSAWRAFVDEPELARPPSPAPSTASLQLRPGRNRGPSIRSRRDVRSEDRSSRRLRPGVVLGIAAAGAGVLAAGAIGAVMITRGGDSGPAVDAIQAPGRTRSVVSTSGVNYTASTLAAQVTRLVARTRTGQLAMTVTPAPTKHAAAGGSTVPTGTSVRTAGTVADPKQLLACLGSLGEHDRLPVAVDLARYAGREAAVIVLPRAGGGFDVWVVARDCRPGVEGELAYRTIKG